MHISIQFILSYYNLYMSSYKKLILLILFSAGCAHARLPEITSTTTWLDSFDSTGSFCLDAYIVNSAAHGCEVWDVRNIGQMGEMRCTESEKYEGFWITSTFVFFYQLPPDQMLPNFEPICGDINIVFGVLHVE